MKQNQVKVLVVKDEDGVLRPMAGVWSDTDAGRYGVEAFMSKPMNAGLTVVKAVLTETVTECGNCGRPATHSAGGVSRCDRCDE